MSLFIRTAAIFVYVLAILTGLKSFSDLMTGTAELNGHWWLSALLLAATFAAATGAWFVDRKFCRADRVEAERSEE